MGTTYSLDQFLADTRTIIKTKGIPAGLAEVRDHLDRSCGVIEVDHSVAADLDFDQVRDGLARNPVEVGRDRPLGAIGINGEVAARGPARDGHVHEHGVDPRRGNVTGARHLELSHRARSQCSSGGAGIKHPARVGRMVGAAPNDWSRRW